MRDSLGLFYTIIDKALMRWSEFPPQGPEDETVLVALTQAEVLLLGTALPVLEITYPHEFLHAGSVALQDKLVNIVRTQHPDWIITDWFTPEGHGSEG